MVRHQKWLRCICYILLARLSLFLSMRKDSQGRSPLLVTGSSHFHNPSHWKELHVFQIVLSAVYFWLGDSSINKQHDIWLKRVSYICILGNYKDVRIQVFWGRVISNRFLMCLFKMLNYSNYYLPLLKGCRDVHMTEFS